MRSIDMRGDAGEEVWTRGGLRSGELVCFSLSAWRGMEIILRIIMIFIGVPKGR
jgi:hypothetical protein